MAFRFGFFGGDNDTSSSNNTGDVPSDNKNNTQKEVVKPTTTTKTLVQFKTVPEFCQDAASRSKTTSPLEWNFDRDVVSLMMSEDNNNNTSNNQDNIRYFSASFLKRALEGTSLADVDSDIIQGVYLGGLKCWSCTADVVRVIFELGRKRSGKEKTSSSPSPAAAAASTNNNKNDDDKNDEGDENSKTEKGKEKKKSAPPSIVDNTWISEIVTHINKTNLQISSVADIGCGLGLCGMSTIMADGILQSTTSSTSTPTSNILFHDFNEEIATMVVSGTLNLNLLASSSSSSGDTTNNIITNNNNSRIRVAAGWGDWTQYYPVVEPQQQQEPLQFDLLVAADVSYDEEAAIKFIEIAERLLKKNGIAIVGTKSFYFGTNGGIDSLLNRVNNNNNTCNNSSEKKKKLRLLCQSPRIGGESDMLRFVLCLVKEEE